MSLSCGSLSMAVKQRSSVAWLVRLGCWRIDIQCIASFSCARQKIVIRRTVHAGRFDTSEFFYESRKR